MNRRIVSTLWCRSVVAVIMVSSSVCAATPAEEGSSSAPTFERPKYQVLRHREDWSVLTGRDRARTGDLWDPIKFVPLSDDESIWASSGQQARVGSVAMVPLVVVVVAVCVDELGAEHHQRLVWQPLGLEV